MFGRIFLYNFKAIIRNKYMVGWNFLFPIVLATVFYLGFGNLIKDDPDNFDTTEVGYVNTNQEDSSFETVLEELTKATDDNVAVLSLHKYDSKEKALKAMTSEDVFGFYVESSDGIETIVPKNGYHATIMNQIVREYENKKGVIESIAADHPENIEKAMDMVTENLSVMSEYDFGNNTSPYVQYFFALIAMSSLFSSWISTAILEGLCANMTEQGKRFECSPTSKLMAIVSGICSAIVLQAISNAVVVVYVQKILKINLGAPIWNIILITTLGSALGVSAGVLIGSFIKNQHLLIVVPLCFTMICSFFSGLMWHQIKQYVETICPIFNRLNPAALLVDCLYTRATYGKTTMYYQDITIMSCMVVGCLIISAFLLRRRKYVSL
ncbi:ABC-2 type transport system permease protein [Pseudobutyrivibrio sp. YE44]|uniref:ABC transporter permease n=1 Tax=Pseudobutyrivibrio sp. YE44 TaxID=1520802 RepID=UPI00087F1BD5|nr:ABC transporter permease [Pseudobutyrivibrio sp. YE44]SDB20438.1 ABC-2 type transport system permease protein [Pseudobutyrivibrio sp. YE44]